MLCFRTSGPRNCEEIHFCCVKSPGGADRATDSDLRTSNLLDLLQPMGTHGHILGPSAHARSSPKGGSAEGSGLAGDTQLPDQGPR